MPCRSLEEHSSSFLRVLLSRGQYAGLVLLAPCPGGAVIAPLPVHHPGAA